MKALWFLLPLLLATSLVAADLPTVSIEHLYYLQARADRVRKMKPDEMTEYCVSQKIGGTGFDYFYSQLFGVRVQLAKLYANGADESDQHVQALKKEVDVYSKLLQEEVQKTQNGLIREGQIATDALQAIGRAQAAH